MISSPTSSTAWRVCSGERHVNIGYRLVCLLAAAALVVHGAFVVPACAQGRGEPIFNPRFEEKRREDAKTKKKIVVPSFTRYIKTMREICQAIATDGRLGDFQKVAGAQPDFSRDCPSCRPFFRIWFSSCQISGTGNLKFSPPAEPTSPAGETQRVSEIGGGADAGGGTPSSDAPTPAPGEESPSDASEPAPTPVPTDAPAEEESPSDGDGGEEEDAEEDSGEPQPTPTPTPRPIGPERDPNIVVIDLISRLFQTIAEAPGAELAMMAVDLFVAELRNPAGKTESAQQYFDTLAEFMTAPFDGVRAELRETLDAQKAAGEGERPEANVDEMFDF